MAVLMECPYCRRKQGLKNKTCTNKACGMPLEKGKGRFWIVYCLDKKQIWELVEPNPYSISDAQACEGKRRGQRREGKLTILDVKGSPPVSFAELAESFLQQDFNKSKKSYDTICLRVKSFKGVFGAREVATITNSEIKNYQAKRLKEIAHSTVDQEMSYAKAIIKQAIADKKIPVDALEIFNGVKKTLKKGVAGKPENAKDLTFADEELSLLFKNIPNRSKLPFVLMALTGMRQGEVLKLRWDRLDGEQKLIELKSQDTKEGKAKPIPLPKEVYPILQGLYKERTGERIFRISKDQFIGDFKKACKLSSIKYGRKNAATAHTLRHTFNTRAIFIPLIYRKILTGHSSSEMDERYSHPKMEDLRGAMESVNKSVSFLPLVSEELKEPPQVTP